MRCKQRRRSIWSMNIICSCARVRSVFVWAVHLALSELNPVHTVQNSELRACSLCVAYTFCAHSYVYILVCTCARCMLATWWCKTLCTLVAIDVRAGYTIGICSMIFRAFVMGNPIQSHTFECIRYMYVQNRKGEWRFYRLPMGGYDSISFGIICHYNSIWPLQTRASWME